MQIECGEQVRGMKPLTCKLSPNHTGYHSCVVFECDDCGRRVRGEPYSRINDREGDVLAVFCFPCTKDRRFE